MKDQIIGAEIDGPICASKQLLVAVTLNPVANQALMSNNTLTERNVKFTVRKIEKKTKTKHLKDRVHATNVTKQPNNSPTSPPQHCI